MFLAASLLTRYDPTCLNGRMTIEHRYDFVWLNAVAEDLDLFIDSSQIGNLTVGEVASQVSRPI